MEKITWERRGHERTAALLNRQQLVLFGGRGETETKMTSALLRFHVQVLVLLQRHLFLSRGAYLIWFVSHYIPLLLAVLSIDMAREVYQIAFHAPESSATQPNKK